jgi:hypothetical protein
MNIFLWVLQVALAWLCVAGGAFQIFKLDELAKGVASMRALPRGLWKFLGAFGCVCGLALIVPPLVGMPMLTVYAAAAVAAQSLLICTFYVIYRDFSPLGYSAAMALIAAFIAYGRLVLSPF